MARRVVALPIRRQAARGAQHLTAIRPRVAVVALAFATLQASPVAGALSWACRLAAVGAAEAILAEANAILARTALVAAGWARHRCAVWATAAGCTEALPLGAVAVGCGAAWRACPLRTVWPGKLRVTQAVKVLADAVVGAIVGASGLATVCAAVASSADAHALLADARVRASLRAGRLRAIDAREAGGARARLVHSREANAGAVGRAVVGAHGDRAGTSAPAQSAVAGPVDADPMITAAAVGGARRHVAPLAVPPGSAEARAVLASAAVEAAARAALQLVACWPRPPLIALAFVRRPTGSVAAAALGADALRARDPAKARMADAFAILAAGAAPRAVVGARQERARRPGVAREAAAGAIVAVAAARASLRARLEAAVETRVPGMARASWRPCRLKGEGLVGRCRAFAVARAAVGADAQ